MKKNYFVTIFITTHIFFIALQIHKHSQFVKESYQEQKLKKQLVAFEQHTRTLTHQLLALQNKPVIKQFAKERGMQKIKLSQIKKFKQDDHQL